MTVFRKSLFAGVLLGLGCGVASDAVGPRPLTDARDRVLAPEELVELGVYSYAVRDDGRIELFDEAGGLVSVAFADSAGGHNYAEATFAGSHYVIESFDDQYSLRRDGVSLSEFDVRLALDAGLAIAPPLDSMQGFQMVSAGAYATGLQDSDRAGHLDIGDLAGALDPALAICKEEPIPAPVEDHKEARVGGVAPSHTAACAAATLQVNQACSNDVCLGCKTVLGCDAYCLFGDFVCVYAVAYGVPCQCPSTNGKGEGGDDDGGDDGGDDGCGADPCCGSDDPCCGSDDPCCGSDDPCCGSDDECCGSDDPCCGSEDECCGSDDPCCGSDDPCCGSDDPCCGSDDPCCGSDDPCCDDPCCDWLGCC